MTDSLKKILRSRDDVFDFMDWFGNEKIPDAGWELTIREYEAPRSLSQNALMWLWFSYLVEINCAKDPCVGKDDWHDYFVHKFLGWTKERWIGKTKIPATMKHTSDLKRSEMTEFLYKIEAFCAERNIYLPIPEEALYIRYREQDFGQVA